MRTVSADYSQGNEALFGENAGKLKQYVDLPQVDLMNFRVEHVRK